MKQNRYIFVWIVILIFGIIYISKIEKVFITQKKGTVTIPNIQTIHTQKDPSLVYYPVTHIIDGDTIDVLIDNKKERVRLLGINTPESVDPRRTVECFGKEASVYISSILSQRQVTLSEDPNKPNRDENERLLRYVFRDDGLFINEDMIKKGYAYEYTYHGEKYIHQNLFKTNQTYAREHGLGLWNKNTCNGKK